MKHLLADRADLQYKTPVLVLLQHYHDSGYGAEQTQYHADDQPDLPAPVSLVNVCDLVEDRLSCVLPDCDTVLHTDLFTQVGDGRLDLLVQSLGSHLCSVKQYLMLAFEAIHGQERRRLLR